MVGPSGEVGHHIIAQTLTASPVPEYLEIGIDDTVGVAERPGAGAQAIVDLLPERPARFDPLPDHLCFAFGTVSIALGATDMRVGDVHGRCEPRAPLGATGIRSRLGRPKPRGRRRMRPCGCQIAQYRWCLGQDSPGRRKRRNAAARIDGQVVRFSLLPCGEVDLDGLESQPCLLENDMGCNRACARPKIKYQMAHRTNPLIGVLVG